MNTPMLLAALSMMGAGGTLLAVSLRKLTRAAPEPLPLGRPRRTPPDRQAHFQGLPAVGRSRPPSRTEAPTVAQPAVRRTPPPSGSIPLDFTSRATPPAEAGRDAVVESSERPTVEVAPVRARPQKSTAVVQVSQELLTRSTPPWRRPRVETKK